MIYKLYINTLGQTQIMKIEDRYTITFSEDLANKHYQEYLEWLEEGNTPLPADEENN
jgi:hypothetical protein